MSHCFRRSFLLSGALLILSSVAAFASVTDSAVHTPPAYDTFTPPGKGASYNDPVFGTSIKRLSDAMNMTNNAGSGGLTSVGTEYSTASPFNSNNTRLILQHDSYFGLYDGNGAYLRDLPFAVNASTEPRWSRTDPNVLFYVSGNRLMRLDVAAGASSVLRTFSEYSTISGKGESDISRDGDHFVFAGNNRYVFVYEMSSGLKGPVLDTAGHAFDNLYITPSNSVALGWIATGSARYTGVELFDINMRFQRQLTHAIGHQHLTRDTNGDDVLIWTNSNDAQPLAGCQNGIVKVRLADARQSCLLQLGWNLAVHITAPDGNGWTFVETYAPSNPFPQSSNWTAYTNEIVQVKLDGSEKRRLVHHRSRPFDSYVYQPRVTVSRDGSKLVFTSNQNLQRILGYPSLYTDVYLVNVSGAASPSPSPTPEPTPEPNPQPTPAPTPTPKPTPKPGPTPTPAPPPPGGGSTVYEQNSSAVTYTGSWSPNGLAAHSGRSATLAMDAGATARLTFTGRGVSWIGYRDEWSGIARVRVDGVLKGTVDTYASPGRAQATLYSISGLSNASHTLTIEVTGTHGGASQGSWIWVDAFNVTR
jgi:Tol biopolymer transport system component